MLRRSLLLAGSLLLPLSAAAETYHVAPGGNDSNDGSASAPWATLQHAADEVQAGDTVLVHDGTYVGFQIKTSGTASDPIVFRALSLNVVVNEENPVRGQHNINVEGANYVVIEGFRVRDAAVAGIRVVSARGVVVRDNVAGPNGRWGIFTGFAPEVQILDNVTFGSVSQHGIYVSNSNVPDDNPVIQGNESYGNGQNGIQLNGDCHANGDGVIEGALVENNVVHDNTNKGLSIISAPEARIQNNVIYDNGIEGAAGGIHLVDEPDCGLPTNDAVVVNNTVVEPRIAGIRMNLGASGNVVFNNLIVSSNPIADEEGTNLVDPVSNLTRSSTAGLFVDADAHDYRLTPGSPALDAGTPSYQGRSAPGVDIDEVPRPVGPAFDAGAYEGPTPVAAEDLPPSSGPMLHPNAPNPFRSKTTIRYTGPRAGPVTLQMFDDARGREVATPVEAVQPAGPHVVVHSTHGMNIPASHPRLFWNSTRLAAAQAWLTAHPFTASTDLDIAFKSYVSGTSCATAVNNATSYLVPYNQWNPSAIGSDAYRGTAEPFLLVFDWCYSSFSATSPGTTTLSTSVTPGQAKSLTVGSTTGMFVGEVLTLGSAGAENVIVDQVTNSTTVRVQNIVNSHTNGTTITLLSQRDSFIQKFTIWAQGIQQQSWGGTQNGGMKMSNYYWGNMRNEFEIGVITYGDNGSGPGSAPDNLIDNALVNRWTNQIVANAGANGSLSGGIPQEGMEYGAAQFQYMIIPFFSAKDMGRDLILETPFMKQLLYWALYSTTPSKTLIKDVTPNITEYFISTWSDDEITASGGGILWARAYIEDGMNTMAQLFATNSPSTNLGPYARQYLNTLGISIPLNLDPYATGTRAYYVSNFLQAADPGGSAGSYSSLPLDYYATGYQAGIWKKAWDTSSSFVFYQFSKPADSVVGHAHSDFGNFDIWRNGRYLSRKTISYNNIIAGEPNINANANQSDVVSSLQNNVIAFTNVALGQDSNPSYTMPSIRLGDPVVTRLESNADYGYVASDLTNVYKWDAGHSSFDTGVVGSVVREMIYIRSLETLVVFDRVVTANQTHGGSLTAAQVVTSALHHYEVAPVQDGGASDYNHWTSTNGTQVLRQTVLIPAGLTASNARLIDEASCAGCDAVGQMRLDIDNSGVATRYHLSVLQARDTSGTNHAVGFTDSNSGDPTLGTFTITTTPSGGSATTIVFNKGANSSGGTIAVAGGSTQSPRSDVQGITYTDNGPVWSIPVTPSVSFQGAKVQ